VVTIEVVVLVVVVDVPLLVLGPVAPFRHGAWGTIEDTVCGRQQLCILNHHLPHMLITVPPGSLFIVAVKVKYVHLVRLH